MTKETLQQVYYINRELRMWERELDDLRSRSAVRSPLPMADEDIAENDPTASIAEHRITVEEHIQETIERLQAARDEAMAFIDTIPDSLTRMIVYRRCISLMTWRRVAYEVGGYNTEDGVRMIFKRFMEKME